VDRNKGKTAAFFDFDGTILVSHTAHLVARYLRDRRLRSFAGMPLSLLYLFKVLGGRALRRSGMLSETSMAALLIDFYRGRDVQAVEEWATRFYVDYIKPDISPQILRVINKHRESGHVLVMVSGQVKTVLKHAADDMGFDHVICTDLETDERGKFTGRSSGMICVDSNKRDLAFSYAAKNSIDLSASFSYGNNEADEAILGMVGNSVAVGPTKRLEAIASARGWKIIRHE